MSRFEPNRVDDPLIRLRLFGVAEGWSVGGDNIMPRGRKAQAILCYLALAAEDSIPRQRLVSLLWSGRWAEQGRASLRQSLLELRAALAPCIDQVLVIERDRISLDRSKVWIDGLSQRAGEPPDPASPPLETERLLETLLGLDPQFDAWIQSLRAGVSERLPDRLAPSSRPALPPPAPATTAARALMLAVAPIIQIGGGVIEDYVPPALTQEIVTALARFRWMQVRFSQSPQVCDATYRLEGYISRRDAECRVVIRLIDQVDRDMIAWTTAVDAPYPLPFEAISEVVERVVEQLDPEILAIETRKASRRPPESYDSFDCVLRASQLLYRFDHEAWRQASALLERAVALDPQHGRAHAFSALCRLTGLAQGWSERPDADLLQLDREAAAAVACDARDSLALALAGHIRAFLHHDFKGARDLFVRALRANPSCGFAWGYSSLTYAYLGECDEAYRRLERARMLMIHDPYCSFMDSFHAVITWFAHDWPGAIESCRRQLAQRRSFTNMRKLLVGALCFQGDHAQARLEHQRLMDDEPQFTWARHLESYPFGRARDRMELKAALTRAGLLSAAADHLHPANATTAA